MIITKGRDYHYNNIYGVDVNTLSTDSLYAFKAGGIISL